VASFSDDFNRADSNTTLGGSWTALGGSVWGIASNQAYNVSGSGHVCVVHDSGTADVEIETTFTTFENSMAICFRVTDNDNFLMAYYDSGVIYIYKRESGGFASLASASESRSHGDVWKVVANGTAIGVFHNGVSAVSTTSSFNLTATKHGLETASITSARFDAFSITDLGGGPTFQAAWARGSNILIGAY
jgi:hypothetical protein